MNYENMTDFEINRAVAESIGYIIDDDEPLDNQGVDVSILDGGYSASFSFNPCNNWADAGPIIERNCISLDYIECEGWTASDKNCDSTFHENKNPLRAAMIVYLQLVGYAPE